MLLYITHTARYSVLMKTADTTRYSVVIFCMVLVLYQIQRINCGVLFLLTAGVYYLMMSQRTQTPHPKATENTSLGESKDDYRSIL